MLRIGLTGGIASGKSEAARHFASLGVPVIDADTISRELVTPGQPLLDAILSHFGDELLLPDGQLDRAMLGQRIFADPDERRRLEALTHPAIRHEMLHQLTQLNAPYVILMVPLLVETGMNEQVDRVLLIDTPLATQQQRIRQRDGHDAARITQILAAQADRATRLAAADDVIINDRGLQELHQAVEKWHKHYTSIADK